MIPSATSTGGSGACSTATTKSGRHLNPGLYIHLPFCTKKCPYCHFYVHPNRPADHALLMEGLRLEWNKRRTPPSTVYFGGGTPSLMGPEPIAEILSWIPGSPEEITLELNPEESDNMAAFRAAGVNRVSIGVQTLDETLLKTIGRTHTSGQAIAAIEASAVHFNNITVDLMLEIPGQTPDQVRATFERIISLPITHLSLYNLVYEPPSLFYKTRPKQPPEGAALEMHHLALEILARGGFERYEVSAFARSGHTAQHNTLYWTGQPFLGLGPSAFSYLDGERFRNVCNLRKYTQLLQAGEDPIDFREKLEPQRQWRELLAVELRLLRGVPRSRFRGEEGPLLAQGLLEPIGERLRLSERGLLFYDTVASELI